jgi:mannose-1-phosphate guanylyltransferase
MCPRSLETSGLLRTRLDRAAKSVQKRRMSPVRPLPAVVLVGGEGTRLRPLTDETPKAMLPLLGRPVLEYALDHLRASGVTHAVLACAYSAELIRAHFGDAVDGMTLEYRIEPAALGTGGAIRFAAEGTDQTFLAVNGDSITDADLRRLVEFHGSRKAKATILLTHVSDPTGFGLVRVDHGGRVRAFIEKPPGVVGTELINAGVYVLEPDVLELIPSGRTVSIESDVFPILSTEGALYALDLPGYWLDVGTRDRYLQAHFDLLHQNGRAHVDPSAQISSEAQLLAPVQIDAEARVESGACVGPGVYVGPGAQVGAGAIVSWSVVLPDATVAPGAQIARTIIAPGIGLIPA